MSIKKIMTTALTTLSVVTVLASCAQTSKTVDTAQDKTRTAVDKTQQATTDAWITTKVKSALIANPTTKAYQIHVDTVNHVVSLSGTVSSRAAYDEAVREAATTEGVAAVNASKLMVK